MTIALAFPLTLTLSHREREQPLDIYTKLGSRRAAVRRRCSTFKNSKTVSHSK